MANTSTTGELFKAKAILDEEVNTAVDAYLATPDIGPFSIAKSYQIDIAGAAQGSQFAHNVLAESEAMDDRKRKAVRTAILLARPPKGK